MKKSLMLSLILILCIGLLAGCGSSATSKSGDGSLKRVKDAGVITVGLDDTYPPMEFTQNGKIIGFDIDIANAVGKKLGVKVKIQPTSWDGIFLALNSKKFDVIQSAVSMTADRKKTMIFTKPYIYGGNAIFVKANDNTIKNQDSLKGKVVGIQVGTTAQDALNKVSGIKEVKKYNSETDAFMDLKDGRISAVVSDPQVGDYYIADKKSEFKKIKSMLTQEPIAVAFRKNDVELKDAYDKAMDELKKDGTLGNLSKKWFGYNIYTK
ncbi:MAG: ABC transporter substrate-binding protein [Clostridium sp.]|nr:ABC transporter substrate-binding protein [Clostridium sp.]